MTNQNHQFKISKCHHCGCDVADNWYIRHVKSGCKAGNRGASQLWACAKCDNREIGVGFTKCPNCGAEKNTK